MSNMTVIKIKKINDFKYNKLKFKKVYFLKTELASILNIYSRNVSRGIWKDYALDCNHNSAIFSIYKSSFERAVLEIHKKKVSNVFEFLIIKNKKIIYTSKDLSKVLLQTEKIPKIIH